MIVLPRIEESHEKTLEKLNKDLDRLTQFLCPDETTDQEIDEINNIINQINRINGFEDE